MDADPVGEPVAADAAMDGEPAAAAEPTNGAAAAEQANGEEPPKKKRGKPKDELAPKKPKNAFQRVTGEARARLKEERPELATDLKAMGQAMKEVWENTPQEEKDRLTKLYEAEMEIFRPKWAEYIKTDHYKEFFEIRQDWIDIRMQKKLRKTANKEAPKRPKSGYMIFAGEIRERVQKEVQEAGGGMGDIGKKISEEWQAVSEAKRAEYGEQSARLKETFDVEFAEYKKTDAFKNFLTQKAQLEAKQKLKKNQRTKLADAPKRPASAYALYRSEIMPKIVEECKGLTMGEMGKKVAGLWAEVPEEQKKGYQETAVKLKEEYDVKLAQFKADQKYTSFLEDRMKTKARENRLVTMLDMPKRPKSVFAMYAEEHKKEVEPGKGEGKGRSALKQKFLEASETEKAQLAEREQALREEYKKQMAEWKDSDKYKGSVTTQGKIKQEFMNEAMKVMTLKFLSRAPPQPPRSPFAVFLNEKRAAEGGSEGSNKKQKKEEVTKFKEEWLKLDRMTRQEYDHQRKEKYREWQEVAKEYMNKDEWKEYVSEAKRLKLPVQSLLSQKKKVIKRLKNGMRNVLMPEKPIDFPVKPKDAFRLFAAEKRGQVATTEIANLWSELPEDEKKKFKDEADELQANYVREVKAFRESEEGSTYLRKLRTAQRTKKMVTAKFKYLQEMPKKPPSALKTFMLANVAAVKKENPLLKGFDLRKVLEDKWKALEDSEREALMAEAKAKEEEYAQQTAAFRAGENWQKYTAAIKVRKVTKDGKAIPQPPPKPASFPAKPLDVLKQFCKDKTGSGMGLADLHKAFQAMDAEEKEQRVKEAQERMAKYEEDMSEWRKSDEGKKYLRMLAAFEKRKRLTLAKTKFLKDEPKKPQSAFAIFQAEKKPEVHRDFPDVKGVGPLAAKMAELWRGLSEEERAEWDKKEAEAKEAYQLAVEEFQKSADYKKYKAIVTRVTGSAIKSGKGKGKGKGASKSKLPVMPPVPDTLPKKPAVPMGLYAQEVGLPPPKAAKGWVELGAEGQKPYVEKCQEKMAEYEQAMKDFMKTAEAKKYFRLKAAAEKKVRLVKAKERFLGGKDAPQEPKRPQSAYFLFAADKKADLAGKSMGEQAREISQMWGSLEAEEKKVYEDRYEESKKKYDEDMAAYRSNPAYKNYEKVVRSLTQKKRPAPKPAPKAAGRGRGRGAAAPAAEAGSDDSDSDVMGSDSDDSSKSSDDSDSD